MSPKNGHIFFKTSLLEHGILNVVEKGVFLPLQVMRYQFNSYL